MTGRIVEDPERSSGRAPFPLAEQARWLCFPLLTYRLGYCSSLSPRQSRFAGQPKCEVISARALTTPVHKFGKRMLQKFYALPSEAGATEIGGSVVSRRTGRFSECVIEFMELCA